MRITAITPISDRPHGFRLCFEWLKQQRRPFDEWVVVDDSKDDAPAVLLERIDDHFAGCFRYVRREHVGGMTYPENLIEAAKWVRGDYFAIVEDDDWRGPGYLEDLIEGLLFLDEAAFSMYFQYPMYHLPSGNWVPRYHAARGDKHCLIGRSYRRAAGMNLHVLCPSEHLEYLAEGADVAIKKFLRRGRGTRKGTDVMVELFKRYQVHDIAGAGVPDGGNLVGIKGMPGKSISGVHRKPEKLARHRLVDTDRSALRKLVGERDASLLLETL